MKTGKSFVSLEGITRHKPIKEKCLSWGILYPDIDCCIIIVKERIFGLQKSTIKDQEIFLRSKFLLQGGLEPTCKVTPADWKDEFQDVYGRSSTNKHGTPAYIREFFFSKFVGMSRQDPFPIDWHPGQEWFTDKEPDSGTFLNPPYSTRMSPETGYAAADTAAHLRKWRTPVVVLYKQGPVSDPIVQLTKEKWVVTLRIEEPITYLKKDGTLHPRPASFKSMILLLGFRRREIVLSTWKKFLAGKWLKQLRNTPMNTMLFVATKRNKLLLDAKRKLLKRPLQMEASFLTKEQQVEAFPEDKKSLLTTPKYPERDLSKWHETPHHDFFDIRIPSQVRGEPSQYTFKQKYKRLCFLKRSGGVLARDKRKICRTAKGCGAFGHTWKCCPLRSSIIVKACTTSQGKLIEFIRSLTAPVLPISVSPKLKHLQKILDDCLHREKWFWKEFQRRTGIRKKEVDFKTQMFGKVQHRIGFWWGCGVNKEIVCQLVRGIRFQEHRAPQRTFTETQWEDPEQIEWLQDWKQKSLRKGILVPIPKFQAQVVENIFLVGWKNKYIKTRLIYDARIVNEYKVRKKFKLPLIQDVLKVFSTDGLVVGADCSSAYSQIPLSPEEMIQSCISIPRSAGDPTPEYFAYTGPAFGCSQVPRVFQRIMGGVRDVFNSIGLPSVLYIDDLQSEIGTQGDPEAKDKSGWYFEMLANFGLTFNDKSLLIPANKFRYLGYNVNLEDQEIVTRHGRIEKLFQSIVTFVQEKHPSKEVVQQLMGRIISSYTSHLTTFVVRQLSRLLQRRNETPQALKDVQGQVSGEEETHESISEILCLWLQETDDFTMAKFDRRTTLSCSTIDVQTSVAVVTDASEAEVGAFALKEGIDASMSVSDQSQEKVLCTDSFLLPENLHGASSTVRELYGIYENLRRIQDKDFVQRARGLRIFSDSRTSILNLLRGKAATEKANRLVVKILALLRKSNKKVQFCWRRRDHRYLELADRLSKRYLENNALLPTFERNIEEYFQIQMRRTTQHLLHHTFQLSNNDGPATFSGFLTTPMSLLVLPHQVVLLGRWLAFLSKAKRKWVAVVPPIWTTPRISPFLAKYGRFRMSYETILERCDGLVKKEAWICSNFLPEIV